MITIDHTTLPTVLQQFLESKGWIDNEKILRTEIPGEGNMNVVLRVVTDQRSFILKQSRPFVQKYPQVAAPIERINTEVQFYNSITGIDSHLPKIINHDSREFLLMMEDLGAIEDYTSIYNSGSIEEWEIEKLISILKLIHCSPFPDYYPSNLELRKINHQHIFKLPFIKDNGFDLDVIQEGLEDLALSFSTDKKIENVVAEMGSLYLSPGSHLLHGDYYPGSWMKKSDRIFILDPEFSFIGFREFDLGVMAAHLIMTKMESSITQFVLDTYEAKVDQGLFYKMTGIEIVRRLIGLAQLPLDRTLDEKKFLLDISKELILS